MNRTKFSKLLMGTLMCSSIAIYAQNYQTMPVQSGFTADVIANGVGSSSISTNNDVDGVSYAFVATDFQLTSSSAALTYGIPVNGIINSAISSTPGLSYQLGSLSANNSLRLSAAGDNGTLTFSTPKAAVKLYMLSTSGSGTSVVSAVVNFTDGTSQTFSSISLSDWYGASNYAILGLGRVKKPGTTPNSADDVPSPESGINPRLYQNELVLDAANQTKLIQSVKVTKVSGSGLPNVFAFSIDAYSTCMPPTLQTPTAITTNSATVSWTGVSSAGVSYDVYYSTSNVTPASTVTPQYPAVTGTSQNITGLSASTNYYYWVRTNCSGSTSQSSWSFVGTFKTACGFISAFPWTENFDSLTTVGVSIIPSCWATVQGTKAWSSYNTNTTSNNVPKSAPNYMAIPYSNTNASSLWTPMFAMNAGATYTFSFYYNTNGTSSSYLGFTGNVLVNSSQSATGATNLGTFITSTQGTATYTLYTVNFTPTTTGNYSFGLNVSSTSAPWYLGIDDMSVTTTNLATNEVSSQKDVVKIHPNPFSDVLNIADVSKVKSISVMDLSGKVVKSFEKPEASLRMSDLSSGMYLVVLNMLDGTKQTIKAIKK